MSRRPNLSRLAKPPVYTHVHFYRQHPGSPSELCQRKIGSGILDPSHPAAKTPYKFFPFAQTEYFWLNAFPNALLIPNPDSTGSPTWPEIDTWTDRVNRASELRGRLKLEQLAEAPRIRSTDPIDLSKWVAPPVLLPHPKAAIPMSLYFSIGKARTHKHAVKRRRLRTKLREAINLIVTRGARAEGVQPGVKKLVFSDDEVHERGDKWILPDWAYICYPDSRLYLAPYPDLTQQIRTSLQKIWDSGMRLENNWATAEMRKQTGSPPLAAGPQTEAKPKTRRADSRARSLQPNERGNPMTDKANSVRLKLKVS